MGDDSTEQTMPLRLSMVAVLLFCTACWIGLGTLIARFFLTP
jgi:hypothetical protein